MDPGMMGQIIRTSIRYTDVDPRIIYNLVMKLDKYQLSGLLSVAVINDIYELLFTHKNTTDETNIYYGEYWFTYLMELSDAILSIGGQEQLDIAYDNYRKFYVEMVGIRSDMISKGDYTDAMEDEMDIEDRSSPIFIKMIWVIVSNIVMFKETLEDILYNQGGNPSLYNEELPQESMEQPLE